MTTRLVVFAAFYTPYHGGFVHSLEGLLQRLAKRSFDITVVTSHCDSQSPLYEERSGVKIIRIPSWNPRRLNASFPIPQPTFTTAKMLVRLIFSPIDVVSTQTRFFPFSWMGALFALLRHKPLIHTERGSGHPTLTSPLMSFIAKGIDHTLGFFTVQSAKKCIGVSSSATAFCHHIGARSLQTIRNGIDVTEWATGEKYHAPFLPEDALVITFVGRLIHGKGVHDLLQAFSSFSDKHIHLLIIGEGPFRLYLEKMVPHETQGRVHFLGEQDQEAIKKILRRTDIFINPSYSEGLPRSVLEAAACAKAVVATDVGGTKELFPAEAYEFLLAPHDIQELRHALKKLLDDPIQRKELGKKFQEHIQSSFDWNHIVDEYETLFSQFVKSSHV